MAHKCGRCRGTGSIRTKDRTSWEIITNQPGSARCPVCHGSGNDPNWTSTRCGRCSTTLEYRVGSSHPPQYCKSCKEAMQRERTEERQRRDRERQDHQRERDAERQRQYNDRQQRQREPRSDNRSHDNKWQEKACPGLRGESNCGNTIRYRTDWDHIPDLCQSCRERIKTKKAEHNAEWLEKPCKTPGCTNMVRYNIKWEHPPNFCKECKEKRDRKLSATCTGCQTTFEYPATYKSPPELCQNCKNNVDLFRSDMLPANVRNVYGKVEVSKGHVTMYFPNLGGPKGYRVSWDGPGYNLHWTNQNVDADHPDRHKPPQ